MKLKYLFHKSISYYRHEGPKGLTCAILRKILRHPYSCYRKILWNKTRKQPSEKWLPKQALNLKLYLNPNDQGISAELAIEGIHEPLLTESLDSLICEGMTVVDVGSNLGYFALLESRLVGPTGKVFAIEPFPFSFSLLLQNIEANRASNIIPMNLAISDYQGKAALYISDQANWNSLLPRNHGFVSSIKVEVTTVDELLKYEPRIDVIRMDIEGYECKAIYGMKNILNRHKSLLIVELHANFTPLDDVFRFLNSLRNLNYDIKWAFPRIKDEVFVGSVLADRQKIYEKLSIKEFLQDVRLTKFKENFTVVFEPVI